MILSVVTSEPIYLWNDANRCLHNFSDLSLFSFVALCLLSKLEKAKINDAKILDIFSLCCFQLILCQYNELQRVIFCFCLTGKPFFGLRKEGKKETHFPISLIVPSSVAILC